MFTWYHWHLKSQATNGINSNTPFLPHPDPNQFLHILQHIPVPYLYHHPSSPIKRGGIMIQLADISSTAVQCQFCFRGFLCPHRHHTDKIPFLRIQCADCPGALLILYVPSSLHGASAVLNPGGYMKCVLQPGQKLLPAGTCYIPSDLLHVRLPVSRVCLHPCHCVPSFHSAGGRSGTAQPMI